jgi:asparagine synthase (glutamine-hydrolysing)
MCGICGKISWKAAIDPSLVQRMMDKMVHRGPDDQGMYIEQRMVLGHRRLSIIDLNTGKQPISNEDDTVWIVFNGEIYNFIQLRRELLDSGHRFKTQTDTEVIVHLYEEYGNDCVDRLNGMFAFAIWDVRRKKLLLARDRVGIKPLYYSMSQNGVSFASEIKALLADSGIERQVEPQTIDKFLTFLYTPGPETMFKSVRKLPPGHYLVCEDGKTQLHKYWDLTFQEPTTALGLKETAAQLAELLQETVRSHMISDVPVGVLLSGGVDSTGLLSFCIEQTDKKVETFTVGFEGEQFADERMYARLAAERYGTRHHEMTISSKEFRDFLPAYVRYMEEPVCEPPAVALYYVTRLAREHVKVLISGEGGDEAFAGYQNYRNLVWLERLKHMAGFWPEGLRHLINGLSVISPSRFRKYSALTAIPLEQYYYSRTANPQNIFIQRREDFYTDDFRKEILPELSLEFVQQFFSRMKHQNTLNKMLYIDLKTWLPDDLLIKADKMTMANSVELRVPLLDHKVLEFAASLPPSYKLNGLTTKYILKKTLKGRIPLEIVKRKKAGFPVPIQSWISGDLKDFTRDLLLDTATLTRKVFRKDAVEKLLQEAETLKKYGKEVFSLVVLELWHREFASGKS